MKQADIITVDQENEYWHSCQVYTIAIAQDTDLHSWTESSIECRQITLQFEKNWQRESTVIWCPKWPMCGVLSRTHWNENKSRRPETQDTK